MTEKKENTFFVITFPPLSRYPIAPKDQSFSTEACCPLCKKKCWMSEKKKSIIENLIVTKKDFFAACYECFEKHMEKNKEKNKKMKWSQVNI